MKGNKVKAIGARVLQWKRTRGYRGGRHGVKGKNLAKIARQERELLERWQERFRGASRIAPVVQQAREKALWREDALSSAPPEVSFSHELERQFKTGLRSWEAVLPEMPDYDEAMVALATTSTATATGSATYIEVERAGVQVQTSGAVDWSSLFTIRYKAIQDRFGTREQVQQLLRALNPRRTAEFDTACELVEVFQGGAQPQVAAGIAMRNVLEHFKGDLWNRAKRPYEQKGFRWNVMVARLAKTGPGTVPHQTLLDQADTHGQLHDELTQVAKALQQVSGRQVMSLLTRLQDHLLIVLSSVNL